MENAANSKETGVKAEPKPPKKVSMEVSYIIQVRLAKKLLEIDFIGIYPTNNFQYFTFHFKFQLKFTFLVIVYSSKFGLINFLV